MSDSGGYKGTTTTICLIQCGTYANFENSPLAHIENEIKAISEKLEIEHILHIEDRENADRQKAVERNRFIITTIIGVVAAIAAIIGTTISVMTYLS